MKLKFSFLIVAVCFVSNVVTAQNEIVGFSEMIHDFGTIGEKDGTVSHDFIITNKSNETLVITSVQATCGCTTPRYTKEPIPPKKSGVIAVAYNPLNSSGKISKSVRITTNLTEGNTILLIKAEVEKDKMNPERKFPVSAGNLRFAANPRLDFGITDSDAVGSATLEIYNEGESDADLFTLLKLPDYITVNQQKISPKTASSITFSFDAKKFKKTGLSENRINVSGAKNKVAINYMVIVRENFGHLTDAQKADKGILNVDVRSLYLPKSVNSVTLKISNTGKSKLNIKNIQSFNPGFSFSKTKFTLNPDETEEITVTYSLNKVDEKNIKPYIYITSDDPSNSVAEVFTYAEV